MASSSSKRATTRKAMGKGGKRMAMESPPPVFSLFEQSTEKWDEDEAQNDPLNVAICLAAGIADRWRECEELRGRVQFLERERAELYQRLRGQAFVLDRGRGQVDFNYNEDGEFMLCVALREGAQQMELSVPLAVARELTAWMTRHLGA